MKNNQYIIGLHYVIESVNAWIFFYSYMPMIVTTINYSQFD